MNIKYSDDRISYKTAKLLKQKDINILSNVIYSDEEFKSETNNLIDIDVDEFILGDFEYFAPTQTLLQKYLRKEYNIHVNVLPFRDIENGINLCYYYTIIYVAQVVEEDILCNESHLNASVDNYVTYENALEAGLFEALKLIPNVD